MTPRSLTGALLCQVLLAVAMLAPPPGGAAATPLSPDWPSRQTEPAPDPWSMIVTPAAASDAPAPLAAARDAEAAGETVDGVVFPSLDEMAPLPPSLAHETIAGQRPVPWPAPTESARSPLESEAPAEVAAADEGISVFGSLMREAPEAVREAARYGLRDVLPAGLSMHIAGLGVVRPEQAGVLAAVIEVAAKEFESAEQRRALTMIGGLVAVVTLICGVLIARRKRGPQPLQSRRFG